MITVSEATSPSYQKAELPLQVFSVSATARIWLMLHYFWIQVVSWCRTISILKNVELAELWDRDFLSETIFGENRVFLRSKNAALIFNEIFVQCKAKRSSNHFLPHGLPYFLSLNLWLSSSTSFFPLSNSHFATILKDWVEDAVTDC